MATGLLLEAQRAPQREERPGFVAEQTAGLSLAAADGIALLLVLFAAVLGWPEATRGAGALVLMAAIALFPIAKFLFHLYPGHGMAPAQRARQALLAAGVAYLGLLGLAVLAVPVTGVADDSLAEVMAGAGLAAALLSILSDPITRRLLVRRDRWCQPVIIFGSGSSAAEVVRQLKLYPTLGYLPALIVDDASVFIAEEELGVPIIRSQELGSHVAALGQATTAIVIERTIERSLLITLYTAELFKRVLLVPQCSDLISLKSRVRRVGGALAIEVGTDRPKLIQAALKRGFDLALGGLALILTAPLMGVVALLVRIDSPGPALFRQSRWAGGSRTFTAFKFRSMHLDGDRRLKRHFLRNPEAEREYAKFRKLDHDPRITRLGAILRKTSLDELPQLFNVMKGEMSLVGPRPYTLDEIGKLGPAREILGLVRPGISGFWQVSGRSTRTFRERIEMDCYYVRNLAFSLDLWIIYRTVVGILLREGK